MIRPTPLVVLMVLIHLTTCCRAASLFPHADSLYLDRGREESAREALREYRVFHSQMPGNADAAWRLSMACHFVGRRYATSDKEKKALFAEGRDVGRESIALAPRCAACEFWTAINMALYGEAVGILQSLVDLGEIKAHLKKSISLSPDYAYGGAYRVLGLIEWRVPGILGGDNDRALEYLRKAVQVAPGEPMNYVNLSRFLEEVLHKSREALLVLKEGLSFPKPEKGRLESREAWSELAEIRLKYGEGPLSISKK